MWIRSEIPGIACLAIVLVLCAPVSTLGQGSTSDEGSLLPGHHLVLLLDTNPRQKKVLDVELAVAEGVVDELNQPGNVFSVITFGYDPPVLVKSNVHASDAIATFQTLITEKPRKTSSSIHVYDSVHLALDELADSAHRNTILVISEGNNYFPGKTFKQTVSQALQLQLKVNVAIVADHPLYGTKGIQLYGFDLRRLAGKTHGQYIEVGGRPKKVPRSVGRLSESILAQDRVP